MSISSVCRASRGREPLWGADVRRELTQARLPNPAEPAAQRRHERRERRRVLAELGALLARNPFLEP